MIQVNANTVPHPEKTRNQPIQDGRQPPLLLRRGFSDKVQAIILKSLRARELHAVVFKEETITLTYVVVVLQALPRLDEVNGDTGVEPLWPEITFSQKAGDEVQATQAGAVALEEVAEVLEAPRVMGVEAENSTEGTKRARDLRIADDKRGNAFVTTMRALDVTIKILAHDGTQAEWKGMETTNEQAPHLFPLEEA